MPIQKEVRTASAVRGSFDAVKRKELTYWQLLPRLFSGELTDSNAEIDITYDSVPIVATSSIDNDFITFNQDAPECYGSCAWSLVEFLFKARTWEEVRTKSMRFYLTEK